MIFQPKADEIARLGLFSLLGGLAVCRAIQDFAGIRAQVKWPNDVLLEGMKTTGILAETSWQGGRMAGLVLGIGINLLRVRCRRRGKYSSPPPVCRRTPRLQSSG